jgi:hypothetical protein
VRKEQKYGRKTKNDYAGEGQQQLTGLDWILCVSEFCEDGYLYYVHEMCM